MANILGKQSGPIDMMTTQIENPAIKMLEKKMKDPKQLPEMMGKIEDITKSYAKAELTVDRYREKVTSTLTMYLKEKNMVLGISIGLGIGIILGFSMFANHPQVIATTVIGGLIGIVVGMFTGTYFDYQDARKAYNSLKEAGIVKE